MRHSGKPLSREAEAELRALEAMPDAEIDTSDAPAASDWRRAERGRFYRPVKRQLTLRVDADVLASFEAGGAGYQTRINEALRACMQVAGGATETGAVGSVELGRLRAVMHLAAALLEEAEPDRVLHLLRRDGTRRDIALP